MKLHIESFTARAPWFTLPEFELKTLKLESWRCDLVLTFGFVLMPVELMAREDFLRIVNKTVVSTQPETIKTRIMNGKKEGKRKFSGRS